MPELRGCRFATTKYELTVTLSLPGKVKLCPVYFLKAREVADTLDLRQQTPVQQSHCPSRVQGGPRALGPPCIPEGDPAWESSSQHPQAAAAPLAQMETDLPTMAWKDCYENRKKKEQKSSHQGTRFNALDESVPGSASLPNKAGT